MRTVASPCGTLRLFADDAALIALYLPDQLYAMFDDAPRATAARTGASAILASAAAQLAEYFAGSRRQFDLPLAPRGTAFQTRCWRALVEIDYGTTTSYGALARAIGRPAASRAVGSANGKNPISIIIPCHRVVGANGDLIKYGGGLPAKRWLLDHEARAPAAVSHRRR